MVYFKQNYIFLKVPEGFQHFTGEGVQIFPGGGGGVGRGGGGANVNIELVNIQGGGRELWIRACV